MPILIALLLAFSAVLTLLILLALAAHRWGADTSESYDSPEWERRQRWFRPS